MFVDKIIWTWNWLDICAVPMEKFCVRVLNQWAHPVPLHTDKSYLYRHNKSTMDRHNRKGLIKDVAYCMCGTLLEFLYLPQRSLSRLMLDCLFNWIGRSQTSRVKRFNPPLSASTVNNKIWDQYGSPHKAIAWIWLKVNWAFLWPPEFMAILVNSLFCPKIPPTHAQKEWFLTNDVQFYFNRCRSGDA